MSALAVSPTSIASTSDAPVPSSCAWSAGLGDLVVEVAALGVSMRIEGGNLRLDGATERLSPERIAAIRTHKAELLALLAACDERLSISASAVVGNVESSAQRLHRMAWDAGGGGLVFRMLDVDGPLDIDLLRAATARLQVRHDLLRSTVGTDIVHDFTIEAMLDQASLDRLCDAHAGRRSEIFQVWRIRHAHGESVAMLARRHVADEASLALLLSELAENYGAQVDGSAEDTHTPGFSEFAAAESRMLAHPLNVERRQRASAALGLRDVPAPISPLVSEHPVGRIERRASHVDAALAGDWLHLAAEQGVAPLVVLAAAFEFAADIEAVQPLVFALPMPNRMLPELRNVVGPFENELGIGAQSHPTLTLNARLPALHARIATAYTHQDLPLPATSGVPALTVRFALQSGGGGSLVFNGIPAVRSDLCAGRDDSILSLRHHHDDDGLRIHAAFDSDRLDSDVVERLMQRYLDTLADLRVFAGFAPDELPRDPDALARCIASRRRDPAVALAKVRGIFAAVLGLTSVASDGNFFELAGNSLSVAKVVSRVKREFSVAVSFSEVFRHPTPAGLTTVILDRDDGASPSLLPRPALTEFPASPQQVRYFASYNIAIGPSSRMTVLHGEWDDAVAFECAARHVVERHELLRTAYFERDGKLMQRVVPAAALSIERATLAETDPRAQHHELDSRVRKRPIDLREPPLVRILVSDRGDGGLRSVFAVFNGILDAYSEGLLEQELLNAYRLARAGRLASRPPLPLQYQDFCRWQNELAQTQTHAVARTFWNSLYPPGYPGFHYPIADGRPRKGEMRIFLLGETLSDAARAAAAACESSLFGFLLANFFELGAEIYQRHDVSVGLLYHGRESEEMQDLIGYFVDLFCLRSDTNPAHDFGQRVRQVNDVLFRSVDMRTYQYHELAASHGHSPSDSVFPITGFHVNNVIVPGKEKQLPADFTSQVLALPYAPKFDFNIYVHESNRGILLRMAYATCVADEAQAERIAERFIEIVHTNTTAIRESRA